MTTWTHFEFTSGANPYIAFVKEEAEELIRKYKQKGYLIEELSEWFYRIHDK